MPALRRVLVSASVATLCALLLAGPVQGAPSGTFAGEADGEGLSIALTQPGGAPGLALDIGFSTASLASTPTAAGLGAGIVQEAETVAETDAPPADAQEAFLADEEIGSQQLGTLAFRLAKGTSASTTDGDGSTANRGELTGAELTLNPGGVSVLGTPPFAVASNAGVTVSGDLVVAKASSEEVNIPIQLAPDLVEPICDLLGQIDPGLGQACDDAVGGGGELLTIVTIRILPAAVECVYDGATGLASVPTAQAALLEIQVFDEPPVTVSPGQTIDLLDGTPLHIHAVVGDADSTTSGGEASAVAAGLSVDAFTGDLPQLHLAAAKATCAVSGLVAQPPTTAPPPTTTPHPQTGAPLNAIYLAGGAMVLLGLGIFGALRRRA